MYMLLCNHISAPPTVDKHLELIDLGETEQKFLLPVVAGRFSIRAKLYSRARFSSSPEIPLAVQR